MSNSQFDKCPGWSWLAASAPLVVALGNCLAQPAIDNQDCGCWIDAKTGKPVLSAPRSTVNERGRLARVYSKGDAAEFQFGDFAEMDPADTQYGLAYGRATHTFYVRRPNGCWVNRNTGKPIPSVPLSGVNFSGNDADGVAKVSVEPGSSQYLHAYNAKTGQNYARVPCPPPVEVVTEPCPPPRNAPLPPVPAPPPIAPYPMSPGAQTTGPMPTPAPQQQSGTPAAPSQPTAPVPEQQTQKARQPVSMRGMEGK